MKKFNPVNNWVFVEVDKNQSLADEPCVVTIADLPEYLEYEFKKGDKIIAKMFGGLFIEVAENGNHIYAIDVDKIVGVLRDSESEENPVEYEYRDLSKPYGIIKK